MDTITLPVTLVAGAYEFEQEFEVHYTMYSDEDFCEITVLKVHLNNDIYPLTSEMKSAFETIVKEELGISN